MIDGGFCAHTIHKAILAVNDDLYACAVKMQNRFLHS